MKIAKKVLDKVKPLDKAMQNFTAPKPITKEQSDAIKAHLKDKNAERIAKLPKTPNKEPKNFNIMQTIMSLQNVKPTIKDGKEIYSHKNREVVIDHKNKTITIKSLGSTDAVQLMHTAKQIGYEVKHA